MFKDVRIVAGYSMLPCGPYYRCKYKYGVMEDDGSISFWRFMTDLESATFTNYKMLQAPEQEPSIPDAVIASFIYNSHADEE